MARDSKVTKTVPCHHINCKCCELIPVSDSFTINDLKVSSAPGNCSSYNVVYIFICNLCSKIYVGRTVQALRSRVSAHRHNFYSLLANPSLNVNNDDDDTYSLGAHLVDEHNKLDRNDFNDCYNVFILLNCSPSSLEINEHKFIQKLKALKPFGINSVDPFGIPLLDL